MKCKGFTMIELLVVIAILGLLLTLFSPGLIGIKYFAYRVQCGKSMEQLGKGWISYYAENNFNLVSAYTQDNGQCWVLQGNTIESMELGQLWPYIGSIEVYMCPTPSSNAEYYRHFSINGRLNGEVSTARRRSDITDPSRTFLMIEDYDDSGYNVDSWQIASPNAWDDYVSGNHDEGDNLSFVDGHVEYWKWLDEDTLTNSPSDPGSVDLERLWEVFRPY